MQIKNQDGIAFLDIWDDKPKDEQWERNARLGKGDGNCWFCNRRTRMDAPHSVHMSTQGHLFPVAGDYDEHPDSQGWFEIGPECAKKIPAEYVFKKGA